MSDLLTVCQKHDEDSEQRGIDAANHCWHSENRVQEVCCWCGLFVVTERWVKGAPAPQFTGDRPAVGFEALTICAAPGRKRWNGGGSVGVWHDRIVTGDDRENRVHLTQKPIDLMVKIIRLFTDPGDLVCDPFAGSGTTGVAAIRLGRRFIGWEQDPKHYEIASRRLEGAREQMEMLA